VAVPMNVNFGHTMPSFSTSSSLVSSADEGGTASGPSCACSSLIGLGNEVRKGEGDGDGSGEPYPCTYRRLFLEPPASSWLFSTEVNASIPAGLPGE